MVAMDRRIGDHPEEVFSGMVGESAASLTQAEGAGMSQTTTTPIQFFDDASLYAPTDAALRVIATESTMRFWRCKGRGPSYSKSQGQRGKIWYSGRDLNHYLAQQRVQVHA